jgi:hypothetical protein
MNKQKILELTGLSEDQFYDQYPDQETFCSDYPDACNQLEEAQGGMQVGKVYDKYGNETFTPAPDPIHSDWQINDEGMNVRPRTVDRFGNPIGPTTQVLRIPVDRVPFNREPTMQRLNPAMQSLQNASPNNVPTTSPIDILTPLIARYNLPKGMVQNSIPIEKLSAKQTMQSVGSTGAPYTAPVNKYKSIVDLLNSRKMDSSMSSRKKLAEEYDISNYTGTSTQNKLLLDKINNFNEVNKVNNTPSINQINNENYNYLAPPEEKQILNKFIPTKYPNINDVSTRYNSALTNKPLVNVQPDSTKVVPTENPYYKNYIYNAPKTLPCYGKGCAKLVSDELESMGLQPQRTNSWFMRDKVIKNGGIEVWNKNSKKNINNFDLRMGDIVSMDRPGLHYEDEMKNNNPEKLNSEHTEHVGTLVGYTPSGEGLIKHGGEDENTVIQPLSKLQLKNNVTGAILNYKPNSIYRVKGADKAQLKKEYTDYNYNYKPGMESPTKSSFFDYAKNRLGFEQGGTAIFPSMRNFKQGGYYGMDQKFHPNSDSGTYVTGAGYYFDTGGGTAAAAPSSGTSGGVDVSGAPGAGSAWSAAGDGSYNINTDFKYNVGNNDESGVMMGDSASEQSSPFDYNSSQFSEQSANKEQPYDQQQQPPLYDASQYTSEIDPSTGFTKYKKNGVALRNIKREDPTLWNHLKDEGHGARWATGQTDFQRVGRTAEAIGQGLEAGINVAGAIGGYLNNRNKQRNMDKSAINMGSTASMFTNPQGSGKGDYGVTGSTYGQFKPNQSGNMSFKGMYGKYGMQVPSYQAGGGFSNLFTSAQTAMPVISPIELGNNIPMVYDIPVNDNTRVATPRVVENINQSYAQNNNTSAKSIPNPKGKDIATRFNNPGNIIYNPIFAKMFGAVDSGVKQTDGTGHFAKFPNIEAGLKARETQLFGNVDGIFKSKYYKPNTNIDTALKTWSNKGYGVNIYPEIAGKTLAEITPQERRELMKRQIKQESGSMYKYLKSNNYFKYGGQQQGGQVVDMDENQIQQFLAAGGQLEFLD